MGTYTNHIKSTGAPHIPRVALGNSLVKNHWCRKESSGSLSIYCLASAVNPAASNVHSVIKVITEKLLKYRLEEVQKFAHL